MNTDNISPIILALIDWLNGKNISSETLHRLQQFGYIFPNNNGIFKLTISGQEAILENNLVDLITNENKGKL